MATLPVSTGLLWIPDGLTTILASPVTSVETGSVEEGMSPKGLVIISARRVAAAVPCSPRVSGPPTRVSAELSGIREAEAWAGAVVSITGIPIVEEGVSATRISTSGLTTKK